MCSSAQSVLSQRHNRMWKCHGDGGQTHTDAPHLISLCLDNPPRIALCFSGRAWIFQVHDDDSGGYVHELTRPGKEARPSRCRGPFAPRLLVQPQIIYAPIPISTLLMLKHFNIWTVDVISLHKSSVTYRHPSQGFKRTTSMQCGFWSGWRVWFAAL